MRRPRPAALQETDPAVFAEPIVVTGLTADAKRAGRVQVEVNGNAVGMAAIDLVGERGLRAGTSLTRTQLEEVLVDTRRTRLLDKALDLLAVRARTSQDLRLRLLRVTTEDDDIAWVIARLTTQGFVDDAAYARSLARGRILSGGVSRRRVESELRRRGVAPRVAAEAIEETFADARFDEHDAAVTAARRRVRALTSLDEASRRRRLYAWLARRGYQPDVIQRVLREVLTEDSD
jgi:regulatory protein